MKGIREDVDTDRKLARVKPRINMKVGKSANGKRWKEGSTGNAVFFCKSCGAPVVDSAEGRRLHAARLPNCRAAMSG